MIAAIYARKSTDQAGAGFCRAPGPMTPVFRPYTTTETVSNEHTREHSTLPRNLPPTLEKSDMTAGCASRSDRLPPSAPKFFLW